ncbi:uncharacterized protein J3D65DRAFT_618031 [Phyllosticta citribraziliensis]|uniref:AAA+ ATPase domain-containing protein n=1 Tax=Phyllosticta citribraziliensis TaxID=989973 RepID=A0ABR1LVN0_9PEZI
MDTLSVLPQDGNKNSHLWDASHEVTALIPQSPAVAFNEDSLETSPSIGFPANEDPRESSPLTDDGPQSSINEINDLRMQLAILTQKVDSLLPQEPPKLTRQASDFPLEARVNTPYFGERPLSLDVKYLSFLSWQPSRGFNREDLRSNVLVVYYGHSSKQIRATDQSGKRISHKPPVSGLRADHEDDPKRVQINSRILLDELEFISGCTMSKTPTVFVPPFKIFVEQRGRIAREIQKKKDSLKEGFVDVTQVAQMQLCISHMEVLLNFIDTDLGDTVLLRQQIDKATIDTIAFENMWHLFPPGTLVFSKERKLRDTDELSYPRAFRVFGVSGGRMNLSSRPPPGSMPGVRRPRRDDPPRRLAENFRLDLHYVDFDGAHIGAETLRMMSVIRPYDGEKKILDLDFYPAHFDPKFWEKKSTIVERGRNFVQFLSESHQLYKGFSTGTDPEEVHGEVVVDARTGYRMAKDTTVLKDLAIDRLMLSSTTTEDSYEWTNCFNDGCPGCTNNFPDNSYEIRRFEQYVSGHDRAKTLWMPNERDQIDDEHLLLLPRDVLSFVFRSRSWKYLNVEQMQSIDEAHAHSESGLDQLVMNERHKKMVLALVESHSSGVRKNGAGADNESSMDLVKGKGKGLVILLHGAPGVGKTLTAETIAAYTRRPLYPITCGDIGETAIEVERKLEHHFKLAHLWGCVLLLDEADVFLAQRENSDVKRNALVSVFLRTLEYYSGILFLTTNRLGAIDEAFHSRIKIAMFYPRLDESSTVQIWKTCLERIRKMNREPDVEVEVEFDEQKILSYAKTHYNKLKKRDEQATWNGRQIRNAFQTAVALAKYDRQQEIQDAGLSQREAMKKKKFKTAKLRRIHFDRVSKVMEDYDEYIDMMHDRKGNDDWAADHDLRARQTFNIEEEPYSPRTRLARGPSLESTPKRPSLSSKRSSTGGIRRMKPAPRSLTSTSLDESSAEESEDL